MPRDQTFEHDLLVESSSGSHQRWKTLLPPRLHWDPWSTFVTVPNAQEGPAWRRIACTVASQESTGAAHTAAGRRQLGGTRCNTAANVVRNPIDELQLKLERVMMLKRRAKLEWQATDDKHVTILIRLRDLRDIGGERS